MIRAAAAKVANPSITPWRSRIALAASRLGLQDEAERWAVEELELARRFGAPRPIGIALTSLGLVRGRLPGLALLEEAVAILERSRAILEHTRALIELGGALRRQDRRTAAADHLRRGLEKARRLGARMLERKAQVELASLGIRPRRTAVSGLAALTPSEHRVATLASQHLTNREIAQTLFVTVKAVEWHLGNAYGRLGVHSRRGLAAAMAGSP